MANAEDVVLYDLNGDATAEELIEMMSDPDARWFATARLASLARQGLVAASWNPNLHPRGHDGKFIEVWGWVRWLSSVGGTWQRGQVIDINGVTGNIKAVDKDGNEYIFTDAKKLFSIPTPKAFLDLPNPSLGESNNHGFNKVGAQGGSNPGAMYQVEHGSKFMTPNGLDPKFLDKITGKYGLIETPVPESWADAPKPAIVYSAITGRIGYVPDIPTSGAVDVNGEEIAQWPLSDAMFFTGSDADVDKAWGEASATAKLLSDGDKVYIKYAKSEQHAANEVLANRLYELAGVNVAETIMGQDQRTIGSKLIPTSVTKINLGDALDDADAMAKFRADFAIDAWLANWDVAGLNLENTQVVDGYPYRIDAGGALLYRAQGGPKGANFGPVVGELDSLRNKSLNPAAAKVFGDVTDAEIENGVKRIAAISPGQIEGLALASGLDAGLQKTVSDTLIARRKYLLDKYGVADPWEVDADGNYVDMFGDTDTGKKAELPEPDSQPWMAVYDQVEAFNIAKAAGFTTIQTDVADAYLKWEDGAVSTSEFNASFGGLTDDPLTKMFVDTVNNDNTSNTYDDVHSMAAEVVASKPEALDAPKFVDASKGYWTNHQWNASVVSDSDLANWADLYETNLDAVIASHFSATIVNNLPYLNNDTEEAYVVLNGQIWRLLETSDAGGPYQLLVENPFTLDRSTFMVSGNDMVEAALGYKGQFDVSTIETSQKHLANIGISKALITEPDLNTMMVSGVQQWSQGFADVTPKSMIPVFMAQTQTVNTVSYGTDLQMGSVTPKVGEYIKTESGDLLRINYVALGGKFSTSSVRTGEPGKLDHADVAWYVSDPYSRELLDAYSLKYGAWAVPEMEKSEVDKSTINALDHKAEINDVVDVPETDEPSPSSPEVEGQSTDPAAGAVGHHLDGVNPAFAVSEPFTALDMESPESLVGKMVLVTRNDLIPEDGSEVELSGTTVNPSFIVGYVESFAGTVDSWNQALVVRVSNGSTMSLTVKKDGYTANPLKAATWRVIENLEPDALKLAGNPTIKADGTIVVNGQVVGEWAHDYAYWNKPFKWKIYGQYTVIGRDISGYNKAKTHIRNRVSSMLVPTSPPVKVKKGSSAAKKVADAAIVATKPDLGGATYQNGDKAELGDWVASTKGGGGFVGKIVGWPNQEHDPGIVFAVSPSGVQKAIKLSGSKKVPAPDYPIEIGTMIIGPNKLPNAYVGHKLASGEIPAVGQKVTAGKLGENKVTGYITNINPKQGWVYIKTDDGKTVSKTMSVVNLVEQPQLWWNSSDAVAVSALATPTKAKGKKKVAGINYPGPNGSVYTQSPAVQQAWLDGHPNRKLSKDGYAPVQGMRIRNKDGHALIITEVAGTWDKNPNRIRVWDFDAYKLTWMSVTGMEVDHESMLTAFDGNTIKTVKSFANVDMTDVPDGSSIWRYSVTVSKYDNVNKKYRHFNDWKYLVVPPSGTAQLLYDGSGAFGSDSEHNKAFLQGVYGGLTQTLSYQNPAKFEKVAEIDSVNGVGSITITPAKLQGNAPEHSTLQFTDTVPSEPVQQIPTPEPSPSIDTPSVEAPPLNVDTSVTPDVPEAPVEVPEAVEVADSQIVDLTANPAKALPSSVLVTYTPPPNPNPEKVAVSTDPELPAVSAPTPLDGKPSFLPQAVSMAEGVKAMIDKKDSTEPGSALTYATGDSDYIEDMAIRYNIEKRSDGTEHLVMRFRLREDVAEGTLGQMVTSDGGSGKKGAWKVAGIKFAQGISDGDLIGVYVSGQSPNPLKPSSTGQHPMTEPNAQVIGTPKLIGKSPKNNELDLYRVTVMAQDGSIGEVDMEQREDGTILTFEYDHDAPAKNTGAKLMLTKTAQQNGWVDHGPMTVRGESYPAHEMYGTTTYIDQTGKVTWPGNATVGQLSKGSGGRHLRRSNPDGTVVTLNAAHSTEGGIGFDTTRRANIAGEVQISTPISADRPIDSVIESLSLAMQQVGVPAEKQGPPSEEQLLQFALNKMVTNYHPQYHYRSKPVLSVNDPRVNETFAHMNSKLQQHLGRNVTLDDVRIHFFESGRMSVVWSPEVAIAIGQTQGVHHHMHTGAKNPFAIFGAPANGLSSTDERWSLGVLTTGQSSFPDMTIGSGDRLYMRPASSYHDSNVVVLSPLAVNTNMDVYTQGVGDNYGRRGETNKMLDKANGWEYMLKRKVEPEQITFWIASGDYERDAKLKQFKDAGVTSIGGRPIEDIIVTADMAKKADLAKIGIEHFANDIPITNLKVAS